MKRRPRSASWRAGPTKAPKHISTIHSRSSPTGRSPSRCTAASSDPIAPATSCRCRPATMSASTRRSSRCCATDANRVRWSCRCGCRLRSPSSGRWSSGASRRSASTGGACSSNCAARTMIRIWSKPTGRRRQLRLKPDAANTGMTRRRGRSRDRADAVRESDREAARPLTSSSRMRPSRPANRLSGRCSRTRARDVTTGKSRRASRADGGLWQDGVAVAGDSAVRRRADCGGRRPSRVGIARGAVAEPVRVLFPCRDSELRRIRGASAKRGRFTPPSLAFPNSIQNRVEWLVLWQRVAGGFSAGQQRELSQRVMGELGLLGGRPRG